MSDPSAQEHQMDLMEATDFLFDKVIPNAAEALVNIFEQNDLNNDEPYYGDEAHLILRPARKKLSIDAGLILHSNGGIHLFFFNTFAPFFDFY